VSFSDMNKDDKRPDRLKNCMHSVNEILIDLGKAEALRQAKENMLAGGKKKSSDAASGDASGSRARTQTAADVGEDKREQKHEVKENLAMGHGIMKRFGFSFPTEEEDKNPAAKGVGLFYEGMTKLTTSDGEKDDGCDIHKVLAAYEGDFDGMLKFLVEMYKDPGQEAYRPRIKFCVVKLTEAFPKFDEAVKRWPDPLPWSEEAKKAEGGGGPVTATTPGVVWIDFKNEAFDAKFDGKEFGLKDVTQIKFQGFHDDARADTYVSREDWLQYVIDHAEAADRISAVVTNRSHLQTVTDIRDFCATSKIDPPMFIVCTRSTKSEEFREWGIAPHLITSNWQVAAKLAFNHVRRSHPDLFSQQEYSSCRYGADCRLMKRPEGCEYRHTAEELATVAVAPAPPRKGGGGYA